MSTVTQQSPSPSAQLTEMAASAKTSLESPLFAEILDQCDPLKGLRNNFVYPKRSTLPGVDMNLCDKNADAIYMCGHSLGLMPAKAPTYLNRELEKWGQMGVHGHLHGELPWAHCDEYVVEASAKLITSFPDEVALISGLTVNLHLLFAAFYRPTKERHKILMENKAFPSDHYMVTSQVRLHGYDPSSAIIFVSPRNGQECLDITDILDFIKERGTEIAVIFFGGVQYYTGQLLDMERITAAGQEKGCIVGFDLAHAIGNVKLKLHDWNVDFAAWCTYKYLNSGAGGIGGIFFHRKWHDGVSKSALIRLEGWWGHQYQTRFRMNNERELAVGADGFKISNPPPLLVAPLFASLDVFDSVDFDLVLEKQFKLTGFLEFLLKHYLSRGSSDEDRPLASCVEIITPSDPKQRGNQLSITFHVPVENVRVELARRGVVCDVREPRVLRVAPVPLYNSYRDVRLFVMALKDSLEAIGNLI